MRSVLLPALMGLSLVKSHPHSGHQSGITRRTVDLSAFRLKATAQYTNATAVKGDASLSLIKRATADEVASELVKTVVPGATFRITNSYASGTGLTHVYFKQTAHGLDIDNSDFNVNVGSDGSVFSYGNNFFTGKIPDVSPLKKRAFSEPTHALSVVASTLQLPVSGEASAEPIAGTEAYVLKKTTGAQKDPEARLVYFVKPDGNLALTWRVETDVLDNWLLSYVDASDSQDVHGVVDYVAEATYQVYPWGLNDPTEGSRQILTDPWDSVTSEFTWLSDGSTNYTTTRGNNAIAQTNPSGGTAYLNNYRPNSPDLKFEYPYTTASTPPTSYVDASVTQLFYTSNTYHDLLHTLGFNEAAGNFETNNNGAGGLGNDFVILNTQDGSGTNNANFATPPDGQNPRMRMYIWNRSTPNRDCSFEAGVVIHEYTHGLSNRLTGGPANSGCLGSTESGGMGEGWSDFFATAIRIKPGDTRATNYPMGAWVNNNANGIRVYVYSTSLTTNPDTYASVNGQTAVHRIGTTWATMLYEVLWNLIDTHGKNDGPKPVLDSRGVPTDGRYLAMKLVLEGMKLQPCNPNFVQARDGIIDADRALTGGANACDLWTAFAKRGLGEGARFGTTRTASTVIPAGVC